MRLSSNVEIMFLYKWVRSYFLALQHVLHCVVILCWFRIIRWNTLNSKSELGQRCAAIFHDRVKMKDRVYFSMCPAEK